MRQSHRGTQGILPLAEAYNNIDKNCNEAKKDRPNRRGLDVICDGWAHLLGTHEELILETCLIRGLGIQPLQTFPQFVLNLQIHGFTVILDFVGGRHFELTIAPKGLHLRCRTKFTRQGGSYFAGIPIAVQGDHITTASFEIHPQIKALRRHGNKARNNHDQRNPVPQPSFAKKIKVQVVK